MTEERFFPVTPDLSFSNSENETCETSIEAAASLVTRPFIYVLRNRENKMIMQIGQVITPPFNSETVILCNPGGF